MVIFHFNYGIGLFQMPFLEYHICSFVGTSGIDFKARIVLMDLISRGAAHAINGAYE